MPVELANDILGLADFLSVDADDQSALLGRFYADDLQKIVHQETLLMQYALKWI